MVAAICALDEHGPFMLTVVSTADASQAPPIWCEACAANVSHLFTVDKSNGVIEIRNHRSAPAIFIAFDDEIVIPADGSAIYERGKFNR